MQNRPDALFKQIAHDSAEYSNCGTVIFVAKHQTKSVSHRKHTT